MGDIILLTGRPGIGKTTVFSRVIECLKSKAILIGGFVSREVRYKGQRIGFEIEDLYTGEKGWLAKVNDHSGLRVGKYRVILDDLESVGLKSIELALKRPEIALIGVDEVAPMELKSPQFKGTIIGCFESEKPFLGTVNIRLIEEVKSWAGRGSSIDIIEIRFDNREIIVDKIVQNVYAKIKF